MFGRKRVKVAPTATDESERIDHGKMSHEEFEKIRAIKVAQYRRQAHGFIDGIETPFLIIAPRLLGEKEKKHTVEVNGVLALAGDLKETGMLLAALYSTRQSFLKEMAKELPEDEMNQLLGLDESLLKGALHGRA